MLEEVSPVRLVVHAVVIKFDDVLHEGGGLNVIGDVESQDLADISHWKRAALREMPSAFHHKMLIRHQRQEHPLYVHLKDGRRAVEIGDGRVQDVLLRRVIPKHGLAKFKIVDKRGCRGPDFSFQEVEQFEALPWSSQQIGPVGDVVFGGDRIEVTRSQREHVVEDQDMLSRPAQRNLIREASASSGHSQHERSEDVLCLGGSVTKTLAT